MSSDTGATLNNGMTEEILKQVQNDNPSVLNYGALNLVGLTNDANGGTLDAQNSHIESNTLGVVTLGSGLTYRMDVKGSDLTSDLLSATSLTATTNNITIDSINFVDDMSNKDKIRIANNVLMDNVVLDSSITSSYYTSNGIRYILGTEKVTTGETDVQGLYLTSSYYRLPDAVAATASDRSYTITPDTGELFETVDRNLGNMGGDTSTTPGAGAKLVIDGGETTHYGINGNGKYGIGVQQGQTLEMKNLGSYTLTKDSDDVVTNVDIASSVKGFKGAEWSDVFHPRGGYIYNAGELKIDDVVFTDSAVNQVTGSVIYNDNGGHISNISGVFSNNKNSYAIYDYGTGTIDNVSIIYDSNNHGAIGLEAAGLSEDTVMLSAITNSQFTNNTLSGRNILSSGYRALFGSITNTKFVNNLSTTDGTVLFGSVVSGDNLLFKNNTTTGSGGAIYGNIQNLISADFINNSAKNGGAWGTNKYFTIKGNVNFTGNHATVNGGALLVANSQGKSYTSDSSSVKFENNYVSSDTGDVKGGALYSGDVFYTKNTEFTNNSAVATGEGKTGYGGAIYNSSTLQLEDVSIHDNAASSAGGGIYNTNSLYIIANKQNVVFENNKVGDITLNSDGSIASVENAVLNDIHNTSNNFFINTASDKSVTFNGTITGSGYLGINQNKGYVYFDEDGNKVNSNMNTAGLMAGDVIFNNDVTLENGTVSVNAGKLYNNGTINTGEIRIESNGTMYSSANDMRVTNRILNIGTVYLSGNNQLTYGDWKGAWGTINLSGDLTVRHELGYQNINLLDGADIKLGTRTEDDGEGGTTTIYGSLPRINNLTTNAAGSIMDFQNGNIDSVIISSINLANDLSYKIDVDLENATADYLSTTSNTHSGNIVINSINSINDNWSGVTDIKVADLAIGQKILLDLPYDYAVLNGIRYSVERNLVSDGSAADRGLYLTLGYYRLADAVHSTATSRSYTLQPDSEQTYETVDRNLGDMGGANSSLTVNGAGYSIKGNNLEGVTIADGQTLTFTDVTAINGFNGNFADNAGSLNIIAANYNSEISNTVNNTGILNFNANTSKTVTVGSAITGTSGLINVNNGSTNKDGSVIFNANVSGNTVNVYSGTLDNNATITGDVNIAGGSVYSTADNISGNVANAGTLYLEGGTTQGNITNYNSTNGTINLENGLTVGHNISDNTINLNGGTFALTKDEALSGIALKGAEGSVIDLRTDAIEHQDLGNITLNGDMRIRLDADLGLDLDGEHTHTAAIDTITGNVISAVEGKKIYVDAVKVLYDASDAPVEFKFAQGSVKDYIDIYADYKETEIAGPADNYLVSYENKTDGGYLGFDYAGLASAIQSTKDQKIFTMHHDDKAKKDLGVLAGTKIEIVGNHNAVNGLYDNGDGTYTHLKGTVIGTGKTMEINEVGSVDASGNVVKSWNNFTNNVTDSNGVINNKGTLKVTDSVFSNNSATNGGVIYNAGTMTLSGTNYFVNNSASNGGAIYNTTANQVIGGVFKDNSASSTGGAINSAVAFSVADNSVFEGNTAVNPGGAIYVTGNLAVGDGVSFVNNTASSLGGAIYAYGNVQIGKNVVFRGNVNTSSIIPAGALYAKNVAIGAGTVFENNYAIGITGGGAIYLLSDTSTLTDTNFTGNATGGVGGAIYNTATSNLSIIASGQDVLFSGNKAGATITYNTTTEQYDVEGGSANDIYNLGTLNLKANDGQQITFGGTITDSATPSGAITIINSGTVNISAGDLDITDGITNDGILNLGSGTLASKNEITGDGKTIIVSGTSSVPNTVISNAAITQTGGVEVKGYGDLTSNALITAPVEVLSNGSMTNAGGITGNVINAGTFDNNALISGTTNNSGIMTSLADNFGGRVTNTNSLTLEGGTLTQIISGSSSAYTDLGNVIISTSDTTVGTGGSINSETLTVNTGVKLINNTSVETKTLNNNNEIANNGEFSLVENTNNLGALSGSGHVNIGKTGSTGANVTVNSSISQDYITVFANNTLNFNGDNVSLTNGNGIRNAGIVNITGGTLGETISGNGTTYIKAGSGTVIADANISGNTVNLTSGTLHLNTGTFNSIAGLTTSGGHLSTVNDATTPTVLGAVALNSASNFLIDVDLSSGLADTFSASGLPTGSSLITINSINYTSAGKSGSINVFDDNLKVHVQLNDALTVYTTGAYKYAVSYDNTSGNLNYTNGNIYTAVHDTTATRDYTLIPDSSSVDYETPTATLGAMEGTSLTITGAGKSIRGNSLGGVAVADGQTLTLQNIGVREH